MKTLIKGKPRNYRAVWLENGIVKLIDQTKLPEKFSIVSCRTSGETVSAIKKMIVRGAPSIGAAGAFAFAQAVLESENFNFQKLSEKAELIKNARPTAVDLMHSVERVFNKVKDCAEISECKKIAVEEAQKISNEYIEVCRKIGDFGSELIKNNVRVLTHCNAGALATVDIGTALAPIRAAHAQEKNIFVFVDETRPRLQGAKLTAWELEQEGISFAVIADNAAGYFMRKKEIDLCIVGADRIAANGDFANKIGTYEKAVLASENGIPFYVAAPLSTFDFYCKNGDEIPIEERSEDEVLKIGKNFISTKTARARNPAFDVTPAEYVTAFITEKGILKAGEIGKLEN